MNINQILFKLQAGYYATHNFKHNEAKRRAFNLQLSTYVDVQHSFTACVNFLNLESNENRYLLSGCSDGSINIHDLFNFSGSCQHTAQCIGQVISKSHFAHASSVECVLWYPMDNRMFTTSGTDKKLKLWDTNELKPIETFTSKGKIFNHQCSSTSAQIAVGSQLSVVELVDLRTGYASHELRGHNSSVMALAWSPRESYVLSSSSTDGKVLFWDVRSAAGPIMKLDNGSGKAHGGLVNGMAFTPDGLHLVTLGFDNRLRLWDTHRGKLLPVNYGQVENNSKRHVQMAVGPQLVFVPSKGGIRRLCLMNGRSAAQLTGHFNRVICCVYRELCQELYSGGSDRNVLVWTANDVAAYDAPHHVEDNWSTDESGDEVALPIL